MLYLIMKMVERTRAYEHYLRRKITVFFSLSRKMKGAPSSSFCSALVGGLTLNVTLTLSGGISLYAIQIHKTRKNAMILASPTDVAFFPWVL